MTKVVVFPGTFDPLTNGHVDLVQRAARQFDTVIVGVAENLQKRPWFDLDERIALAQEAFEDIPGIIVEGFSNLLVDFAREKSAVAIIRGLRAVSDFEYEFQFATMNRRLAPGIETLFLTPGEQYSFVSSSLVKEIARYRGDVSAFVPNNVAQAIKQKILKTPMG